MKKTAIVILNYNGRGFLQKFLPSVITNSQNARIIVADNASTDDSVSWLEANHPEIEVLKLTENTGYSGGYNNALQQIEATYYVLLNSDVEVTPGWLDPIIDYLDSNPEVAAVQPKILDHGNQSLFEYAGAGGGFIDTYGFPFCRGRLFNSFEQDNGQYNDITDIFWASGACLIVRSTDFHESGALDPDFFAHMEEIDLCWRIHGSGKRVGYFGESTVYHVGGGTLKKTNPRKTYLNFRNGLSLLYKNLPREALTGTLVARSFFDMVAIIRFLVILQFQHAWAVVRAHAYFWSHHRSHRQKRKLAQAHMRVHPPGGIYKGSVVVEYFLRKRKKFSDLKGQISA